jgi:hypothetical protein
MSDIMAADLIDFGTRLLMAVGVPDKDAAIVAFSLVGANLRGHDSHGVMRFFSTLGSSSGARSGLASTCGSSRRRLPWWFATASGDWGRFRRIGSWT